MLQNVTINDSFTVPKRIALYLFIEYALFEVGEIVLQLRALSTITEDLGLIPSAHMVIQVVQAHMI